MNKTNPEEKKERKKKPTNADVVAKKLGLEIIDSAYLMNTTLVNDEKCIAAALKVFGEDSKCSFCWKMRAGLKDIEQNCVFYRFPLNVCRLNCLKWLDLEAGKRIPKEWKKTAAAEDWSLLL